MPILVTHNIIMELTGEVIVKKSTIFPTEQAYKDYLYKAYEQRFDWVINHPENKYYNEFLNEAIDGMNKYA